MPARKLPDAQVAEVRRLHASTADEPTVIRTITANPDRWSYERLAERFGVSARTIEKIIRGEGAYATEEGAG